MVAVPEHATCAGVSGEGLRGGWGVGGEPECFFGCVCLRPACLWLYPMLMIRVPHLGSGDGPERVFVRYYKELAGPGVRELVALEAGAGGIRICLAYVEA